MSAVGSTKIVGTPLFSGLVIPPGEALTEGGNDNSTLNGVAELRGLGTVHVTGQFKNLDADVRAALRKLTQESVTPGGTNLWAYGVNRFGQLIYLSNATTGVLGIKIYNFVTPDVGSEGFNRDNITPFAFDLEPGWSDGVKVLSVPAFSLLTLPNA